MVKHMHFISLETPADGTLYLSVEQWLQQYRTLSFEIYCGFMYDRGEVP